VGKSLLDHVLSSARTLGQRMPVKEVRLDVAETNSRGLALFKSRGFEIIKDDHGHYQGGQRALRMRKPL
jgi:ribosomal protein S18 acetylase RimI-like enzyme